MRPTLWSYGFALFARGLPTVRTPTLPNVATRIGTRHEHGGPGIDEALVARLISDQFPSGRICRSSPRRRRWWDNRTFRLGDALIVRLPRAEGYAHQILKESRWLPYLAEHLRTAVPKPLEQGRPAHGYPFAWSVKAWLHEQVLSRVTIPDEAALAAELASFLVESRAVPSDDGAPRPGADTAHRGGPFAYYAPEARTALRTLGVESPVSHQ